MISTVFLHGNDLSECSELICAKLLNLFNKNGGFVQKCSKKMGFVCHYVIILEPILNLCIC